MEYNFLGSLYYAPMGFAVILRNTVENKFDSSTVNEALIQIKVFSYLTILIGVSLLSQTLPHFQQDLFSV
jgi:hypothetical protein